MFFQKVFDDAKFETLYDNRNPRTIGTGTDYVDYFVLNDVPKNVMKGKDRHQRHYVVVKFKVEGVDNVIMQTFFQRYSHRESHWMGCGHATLNLINTGGGMSDLQHKFVEDIIRGKEIEINSGHKPVVWDWIGKKVKLWKE